MDSPGVLFVIHQIGAGSDGGLTSIGEILARAPIGSLRVITNRASPFTDAWARRAAVRVWPMSEGGYGESRQILRRLFRRLINNVRTFAEVRRNGVRVVHLNDHCALWNTAFGAKLAGARLILNVRDGMRDGASVPRWRFYLWLSDCFLVLSRDMATHWQHKLAPLGERQAAKFRHVYSIVDHVRFHPLPAEERSALRGRLGLEGGRSALVYVGRFDEKKAQLAFIREALPRIARDRPDALVCFVGDFRPEQDAYAADCLEAVRTLGLADHVRFVGYTRDVADWYRAADLILLASMREGLARCMIEGICCGTPMVSFAVCSAREILEGYACGVVVPLGDYPAFADAVTDVLNDDDVRAAMARRGAVLADLFSPQRNSQAYADLVAELA
jgi:glycosyltransferase involved in cell wall biosynthesis